MNIKKVAFNWIYTVSSATRYVGIIQFSELNVNNSFYINNLLIKSKIFR